MGKDEVMSWDGNVKVFLNRFVQLAADFWAASLSSKPKTEEREKVQLRWPLNWAVFLNVTKHLHSLYFVLCNEVKQKSASFLKVCVQPYPH